eukprot:TRINITY_DN5161_c0_g1_i9.p1 TRINITY_DN5161_c0_g1~~TRINITY_DN5161_c0_g1_i9.p1  ORF type:complete len:439 (+),score=40.31 TRINITY_DN5161_c0_g1_i9:312-1628(+)
MEKKRRGMKGKGIDGGKRHIYRLLEESRSGKVKLDDRVTDEYIALLHSKALDGDVDFVREVLTRKPEWARKLNSRGQSLLHPAAERGNVDVVKEILRADADADACLYRDLDGMIPLHVAAIKGKLEVLHVLVNANIKTAFVSTDSGEPILHLCAKNNQFKALEMLVNRVMDDDFVMLKDSDDNNILHLLSARNQTQVMKFLVKNTKVDVNAVNKDGLTPLDVLLENPLGIGRLKTQWFFACAGAKRARSIYHHTETEKKMDGCHGRWFIQALLAVVMVIVTFQAGLYPPGGVWQDTGYHNATLFSPYAVESSPPTLVHHYAGKSVLSYVDPKRYKYFSFFNDVAFYSSALVIVLLLRRGHLHSGALKILLTISVLAMCVSSFCLLSFSSPDGRFGARSWTTYTGVVALLFPAEALDKLVVRFKKDLVPQMIGHFLTPP